MIRPAVPVSTLPLAYLVTAVLYNFTEAAFKGMHPVWIVFFLAVIWLPRDAEGLDHQIRKSRGGQPHAGAPASVAFQLGDHHAPHDR